jgi:DNA-binding MarR family transcriptional regulator
MPKELKKQLRNPDQTGPASEAMLNLFVATDYLRDRMEAVCASFGITLSQYNVLHILRSRHPVGYSRNEIVQRMLERAPDVTRLVDRLEQQRLVLRRRSSEDRRLSVTNITETGMQLLEGIEPVMESLQHQYFSNRLGEHDCRELSRICEGIYGVDDNNPVHNGMSRHSEYHAEQPEHAELKA